jgi:hypothetical protein
MLDQISWGDFLLTSGGLLLLYYLVIGALYYRKDLQNVLSGRGGLLLRSNAGPQDTGVVPQSQQHALPEEEGYYIDEAPNNPDQQMYDVVNALTDDLGDLFYAAAAEGWERPALLASLHRKLADHPQLAGTAFETSVNNYIAVHADKAGFTHFSAEEMKGLWRNG